MAAAVDTIKAAQASQIVPRSYAVILVFNLFEFLIGEYLSFWSIPRMGNIGRCGFIAFVILLCGWLLAELDASILDNSSNHFCIHH